MSPLFLSLLLFCTLLPTYSLPFFCPLYMSVFLFPSSPFYLYVCLFSVSPFLSHLHGSCLYGICAVPCGMPAWHAACGQGPGLLTLSTCLLYAIPIPADGLPAATTGYTLSPLHAWGVRHHLSLSHAEMTVYIGTFWGLFLPTLGTHTHTLPPHTRTPPACSHTLHALRAGRPLSPSPRFWSLPCPACPHVCPPNFLEPHSIVFCCLVIPRPLYLPLPIADPSFPFCVFPVYPHETFYHFFPLPTHTTVNRALALWHCACACKTLPWIILLASYYLLFLPTCYYGHLLIPTVSPYTDNLPPTQFPLLIPSLIWFCTKWHFPCLWICLPANFLPACLPDMPALGSSTTCACLRSAVLPLLPTACLHVPFLLPASALYYIYTFLCVL